jgi:AcrR family transcriptional regulator
MVSTRKRTARSAKGTEVRILRAAEKVFGKKGFADATIDQMVELAGVSRGTFYLYFQDKDQVFATLVSQTVAELFQVSNRRNVGSLRDRIEISTRHFLEAFQRHRGILRCLFEVDHYKPNIARLHRKLRSNFIGRIRNHLERNLARGICPPMNTRVAAFALGLMCEAVANSWLSGGFEPWAKPFEFDEVVQELTDLWCRAAYKDGIGAMMPAAERAAGSPVNKQPQVAG